MRLRSGEHIEGALKRFKKLIERSGIRTDMKRTAYYEKPSERRRRAERKRLKKIHQANSAALSGMKAK
jgi:small subunit ribosomal protein S21